MLCPECGVQIKEGSKFCMSCGTAISQMDLEKKVSKENFFKRTSDPEIRMLTVMIAIVSVVFITLAIILVALLAKPAKAGNSSACVAIESIAGEHLVDNVLFETRECLC